MRLRCRWLLVCVSLGGTHAAAAQQVVDSAFRPVVRQPAFPRNAGPVVAIDAGHRNFHTATGRYRPFTSVLLEDGFRILDHHGEFTESALAQASILVIANPGMADQPGWSLPARSAFSAAEIRLVVDWVARGGALFLIADHMPAGGAAADLARAFGAEFTNGYTVQPRVDGFVGDRFTRAEGTLLDHPITRGRTPDDVVDSVLTFVGQGFQLTGTLEPILRFGPEAFSWLPVRTGAGFDSLTPRVPSPRWTHAAAGRFGRGRVVLFGEAGAFTAQFAGSERRPMGLNHPRATANLQLLLNIMRWLSGRLD